MTVHRAHRANGGGAIDCAGSEYGYGHDFFLSDLLRVQRGAVDTSPIEWLKLGVGVEYGGEPHFATAMLTQQVTKRSCDNTGGATGALAPASRLLTGAGKATGGFGPHSCATKPDAAHLR